MTQNKEDTGVYHLTVGTEVSAKYRGAFCEAQIKLVKKNVIFKILNKKNNKCYNLSEENLRGILKIGSVVEAQFSEQSGWQEGVVQAAKDRSSYTVVFDDGDERTLTRGSLCLKGDRHYAKSETLDNLPLTDPENFGTPVLANKKNRSRRRPQQEEDDDSEDQKTSERSRSSKTKDKVQEDEEEATSEEDDENEDERRERWLSDPFMGTVVLVEPSDKRKHWFPGLIVNPLCYDGHRSSTDNHHYFVRSFKNGKFLRVNRSCVKELTPSSVPAKIDATWKDVVQSAFDWKEKEIIPDEWRIDIKDILDDSDEEEDEQSTEEGKDGKKKEKFEKTGDVKEEDEEEKLKNYDFLEALYKFMEDRGSPINKTPVLGYKDLDLYLLFRLVQERKGYAAISSIKEWKKIYGHLGIPKQNQAAGYNVKTAYAKYLGPYEEYCMSWKRVEAPRKLRRSRSPAQAPALEEKKKMVSKRNNEAHIPKTSKKEENKETDVKKKQLKEKKESPKARNSESHAESKTKGRMSPIDSILDDLPTLPRRTAYRRRMSESSSTSDVQSMNKKDTESKQNKTGTKAPRAKTEDKVTDKLASPGAADSEPDDSQSAAKISEKKAICTKQNVDQARRKRRNSTSNVSVQYLQGDKLKVKYGQGKTFKLYDAKVLQVKPPDNPGELTEYLVHYAGWNSRHDEWIKPGRIVALLEERSPLPGSTNSVKSQPRRPKTPNSANGTKTPPMAKTNAFELPLQDVNFPQHILPVLPVTAKPQFPCEPEGKTKLARLAVGIPKKNLTADFAKTALSSADQEGTTAIRPVSPVLRSSKRSKSPAGSAPSFQPAPLPTQASAWAPSSSTQKPDDRTVKMEEQPRPTTPITTVKKETTSKQKSSDDSLPSREKEKAEVLSVPMKKENQEKPIMKDKVLTEPECGDPIVKPLPDPTGNEEQCSEEECSVLKDKDKSDSSSSADDQTQSNSSLQQTRRTSNRRSKSPAYLSDSSLYGMGKRRKNSVSAEISSTFAPVEVAAEEKCLEILEKPETRSVSPTLSTSSTNSSSSVEALVVKEKKLSELTDTSTSNTKGPEENCKVPVPKKKVGRPSNASKIAEQKQKEADREPEHKIRKIQATELTMTEYDNFDEEVPSIALEKPNKGRLTTKKSESIKPENASSIICTTQMPIKLFKQDETTAAITASEAGKSNSLPKEQDSAAGKKEEDGTSRSTKRKIRKKKSISEALILSRPIQSEDAQSASLITSSIAQHLKVDDVKTLKSRLQNESTSMISEDSQESTRPTSNEEDYSQPTVHNIQSLPQNAPSSSKVLLENTPPTTPERSPPYASEDQETDPSKQPPLDMIDIGEEQKDSTGSTCSSSSGCDNQTSSSQEYEKLAGKTPSQDDKVSEEGERPENKTVEEDKQVPSPSPKKKQGRRRKRRRTTSKSQGRRRGSFGAEPDTESEEDDAEDAAARGTRKRHESGSRCKPRKKRSKYRPEPPSAPPPVQCEELASMSQDERIALLQARMAEMRKVYHQLKQEVANIDRKRKRAKRREKEAAEAAALLSSDKHGNSPFITPTKANPHGGSTPCVRKAEVVAAISLADIQEKCLVPDGSNNNTQSATLNGDGRTVLDSR